MYTQCTECKQQHTLTIKKLRSSQAMIRCSGCSSLFNALEHLTEKPPAQQTNQNETHLATGINKPKNINWDIAVALCLIVLIAQLGFFEGYNFTQNKTLRPWLVKACHIVNCTLPTYKNLNELIISHASFDAIGKDHSIFRTAFTNHAAFEQNYPSIKLTLQNFTGDDFAERIFHPQDYILSNPDTMKPGAWTQIALDIVTPPSKMGGYRFELI